MTPPCPVLAILYRRCGYHPARRERKGPPEQVHVPTMYNTERIPDGDANVDPVLEQWREKRRRRE